MFLFSGVLCCASIVAMDKFRKSDPKTSLSKTSREDGYNSPGRSDSPKKAVTLQDQSSSGSRDKSSLDKTRVGSVGELKNRIAQKRENRLTQSEETSSQKK